MNAPLASMPLSADDKRVAAFEEIERLFWAIKCHAECGQNYGALHQPELIDLSLEHIAAVYRMLRALSKEVAYAER